jgi:hypothetical protein
MFTDKEKEWIERCKKFPTLYEVVVDNDSVWINGLPDEIDNDGLQDSTYEFTFNDYGQDFIVNLLKYIGCNADHC